MITLALARIFSIYFITLGLSIALHPARFRSWYKSALNDDSLLLLGGVVALLTGSVIVSIHNVWVLGWPVIITLLGWSSLVKGISVFCIPGFPNAFSGVMLISDIYYRGIGAIWTLIGLFLACHAWL